MKMESTTTQTLKEVTPDKVVVEIEVVSQVNGQEMKAPANKVEYPAKVAKGDAEKVNAPEGKTAEGKESLEVGGKKYDAKWFDSTTKMSDNTTKTKSWTSDDVPGMMLKMVVEMSGQTKMHMESQAVEIKADKK
jgi:hypothetical protein